MFFKKSSAAKARDFWKWFAANHHQYLFLTEVEAEEKERLMDVFLERLHKYCEHLFFEIGGHQKEDTIELIISAEGVVDYFGNVEELVDAAPVLPPWKFLKFRQPHGPGFSVSYGGKNFDPEKIIFLQLHNPANPQDIGIHVCYPDYTDDERNTFVSGTYIMLDSLLGEKSVTLDIDHLDVVKTPDDIEPEHYPFVSALPQFIKEKKIFKYPGENFSVQEAVDESGYTIFITANFAYKEFSFKTEFPWMLKLTLRLEAYNENGHPTNHEAETLNGFEDFLDGKIKEAGIAHYIGRVTRYKKRDVLYYMDNPEQVKRVLTFLAEDADPVRPFEFLLQRDPEWHAVAYILK